VSLVLLLTLPLLAAVAIALAPPRLAQWIATGGSLATAALAVLLAVQFPTWTSETFWPDEFAAATVVERFGVSLELGMDGVSLLMVLLTVLLVAVSVIGSFTAITTRQREYYGWFMVLESSVLLAFMARDAVVFYIGYEFTLVPMFFLISIWGGPDRRPAAIKFFIFTFLASVLMLAGIVFVAASRAAEVGAWSFLIDDLVAHASTLDATTQFWVFLALMAAFAVKTPFFPVHSWLPLAHDQAPTGGSVILAGALLKLGTYGAFRIGLPMAPIGGAMLCNFFAILAIVGIVVAAMICWVQKDVKKLVAYSSVSHMGMLMLGLFALNPIGLQGSVLYFINHGLSTGALFLLIGMVYERYHTKDMDQLGGLAKQMPIWSCFMVFFVLSSVGLPGLNGFIGEFLCLWGCFTAEHDGLAGYPGLLGPWYAIIAIIGLILGAMYLLRMTGKMVWGPLKLPEPDGHHEASALPKDLSPREIGILLPLAALCLFIGLYPKPLLVSIDPAIRTVLAGYPEAVRTVIEMRHGAAEKASEGTAETMIGRTTDAGIGPAASLDAAASADDGEAFGWTDAIGADAPLALATPPLAARGRAFAGEVSR